MKKVPIRLNFYSLQDQELTFPVYRSPFTGQTKQEGLYKAKLPESATHDTYEQYWISLSERSGFDLFECSGTLNPYLTIHVLFAAVLDSLRSGGLTADKDYRVSSRHFSRRIDFILQQHSQGDEVVFLEPYFLKASGKFGFLADFRFSTADDSEFSREIQRLSLSLDSSYQSNRAYYSDKLDKLQRFLSLYNDRVFPITVGRKRHTLSTTLEEFTPSYLKGKIYQFRNDAESNSQYKGLQRFSPLEPVSSDPLYLFIFPDQYKQFANDVYRALVGKAYPSTFPGMSSLFGLHIGLDNVKHIPIQSYAKEDLEKVIPALDKLVADNPNKQLIGVFIEHSRFSQGPAAFSPYYFLKYIFIQRKLPMQAITVETIRGKDGLKWSASNIGLQVFAKLGGTPWKVKPDNEHCLIFGIGSAHDKDSDNNITKYLAYSVSIDSSGVYKCLDVLGEAHDRQTYLGQFTQNIAKAIAAQLTDAYDTCVIHVPFKVRRDEIAAIEDTIKQLVPEHEGVRFLCIKINTQHRFFGYADNNSRVPYESSFIRLSNREYLVWLEGLQYGKENVYKRVGNPIHVEFLYVSSSNGDASDSLPAAGTLQTYLQDIINLSGANWRGFNAKLAPISIFYPQLIARYLAGFKKVDGPGSINIAHLEEPWFL